MGAREELAAVIAEHASDMSDEQKIDGEWVWGLCCDCGEFVPGDETGTHLADAILASPAFARLLDEARREALREAADLLVAECSTIAAPCFCSAAPWLRDRAERIGGDRDA